MPGKETVAEMDYAQKEGVIFVRTGREICSVDAFTGKLKNSRTLGMSGYGKKMAISGDGELFIADGNRLRIFDGALNEKSAEDIGFTPDTVRFLPDGTLMAEEENLKYSLMLKDARGKRVLDKRNLHIHSTIVADNGNIFTVEAGIPGAKGGKDSQIIRFEPGTGQISTFRVTENTDCVIPLKDGSFIAYDDLLSNPRLVKFDENGNKKWNITFEDPGTIRQHFIQGGGVPTAKKAGPAKSWHFLRQSYVSADDGKMFLVLGSSDNNAYLYKIDLEADGSSPDKAPGKLSSKAASLEIRNLFQIKGDDNAFIPMFLDDGKIVIFEEQGIHLLSPDGKELKRYDNIDDLKREISGNETSARRVNTGPSSKKELRGGKDAFLKEVESIYGEKNSALYTTKINGPKIDERGFGTSDSTLNFRGEGDNKTALQITDMKDGKELEKFKNDSKLINFAFAEGIDVPLSNNPGLDRAVVKRNSISIKQEPALGKGDRLILIDAPEEFSTILPVTSGEGNILFAGTTGGMLRQYDMNTGEQKQSFDLGASVVNIGVAGGRKIIAATAEGGIFCLEPKLEDGEKLEGEIRFSDLNTRVSTGGEEHKSEKVVVDTDTRVVTIGGVQLPIKGNKHFYIH